MLANQYARWERIVKGATSFHICAERLACLSVRQGKRKSEADIYFAETYAGLEPLAMVDELEPGTEYRFRVTAANSQGQSAPSPVRALLLLTRPRS